MKVRDNQGNVHDARETVDARLDEYIIEATRRAMVSLIQLESDVALLHMLVHGSHASGAPNLDQLATRIDATSKLTANQIAFADLLMQASQTVAMNAELPSAEKLVSALDSVLTTAPEEK